jgi:hypothetical protein
MRRMSWQGNNKTGREKKRRKRKEPKGEEIVKGKGGKMLKRCDDKERRGKGERKKQRTDLE